MRKPMSAVDEGATIAAHRVTTIGKRMSAVFETFLPCTGM